jgi:Skp family chaperone for outer membrane proteins
MLCRFALFAAGLTFASAAVADPSPHLGHIKPSISAVVMQYEAQAKALQTEMDALRKAVLGQLTPEHRAYLQATASALVAAYHRDLAEVNPLSVNADGTPVR